MKRMEQILVAGYKVKFSFAEKISGQYSAQHKSDNKEYKHMYQAKFIEQLP